MLPWATAEAFGDSLASGFAIIAYFSLFVKAFFSFFEAFVADQDRDMFRRDSFLFTRFTVLNLVPPCFSTGCHRDSKISVNLERYPSSEYIEGEMFIEGENKKLPNPDPAGLSH